MYKLWDINAYTELQKKKKKSHGSKSASYGKLKCDVIGLPLLPPWYKFFFIKLNLFSVYFVCPRKYKHSM